MYVYIHMIHAYTISNSSGVLFPVVGADTSLPWKHLIHIWAPIYSLCVIPWKIIKFQSEIHLQKSSMKKYLWCITVWSMFFLLNGCLSTSFVYVALVHMTRFTSSNVGPFQELWKALPAREFGGGQWAGHQGHTQNKVVKGPGMGQWTARVVTLIRHSW